MHIAPWGSTLFQDMTCSCPVRVGVHSFSKYDIWGYVLSQDMICPCVGQFGCTISLDMACLPPGPVGSTVFYSLRKGTVAGGGKHFLHKCHPHLQAGWGYTLSQDVTCLCPGRVWIHSFSDYDMLTFKSGGDPSWLGMDTQFLDISHECRQVGWGPYIFLLWHDVLEDAWGPFL